MMGLQGQAFFPICYLSSLKSFYCQKVVKLHKVIKHKYGTYKYLELKQTEPAQSCKKSAANYKELEIYF